MTIVLNGTTGITNDGGYTGDGIVFADTTPANTLVTTTGGNVGIGTSSPAQKLHLSVSSGSVTQQFSSGSNILYAGWDSSTNNGAFQCNAGFTFNTGASYAEAMRIDSSRNVLVGLTSNTYNARATFNFDGTATNGMVVNNTAGGAPALYAGKVSGTDKFIVYNSGNVANTNNSYGAISDIKLKENIVDATPKLEDLCKVKIKNYNLIGDTVKQIGVVAQELEQVFPSLIEETVDKDVENNNLETTTKSVKYSVFVPMLIKAIQEQQAIITDLTTRLEALEAK